MFFINCSILSYPIWPQATTSIRYTKPFAKARQSNLLASYTQIIMPYGETRYPSESSVLKSSFSVKVGQHGQQELYLQYQVCWILYKMVGTPSFSQTCLCMKPILQSPPKIFFSTSVCSHLPIPPLLVHKIIFTIPSSNVPLFAYNHRNNLHQRYFT